MNNINKFSITKQIPTLKEFLYSNTLIAKTTFLLLIVFLFIIILNLGFFIIIWFFSLKNKVTFINGMINSKNMLIFPQDPNISSKIIKRSVNEINGIEFTWSVWVFIDELQYLQGQYKHIFHKGNETLDEDGIIHPNNAPGLYIAPNENALYVFISTFNEINQQIKIPNIPLNKWINIIIRCQNNILDIYINGIISNSIKLNGVPKQNYGDVYLSMNGGFSGNTSNLLYYNKAIGTKEIMDIAKKGPNLTIVGDITGGLTSNKRDYLSLRWYSYN